MEELEKLVLLIENDVINKPKQLLEGLDSILGPTSKQLGVNYNVIHLMEYCFYKAANPYSTSFDRYSRIMAKIINLHPQIRNMLNNSSERAIGNMVLGGIGGFKFQIIDFYELRRVIDVWELMGLKRVNPRDVLSAILSKPEVKKDMAKKDVLMLARLNEIFPMFRADFIPEGMELMSAIYEYEKASFEPMISYYIERGYSLRQMVESENRRVMPVGVKRNSLLSYLVKKEHNFQCQICKLIDRKTFDNVETHHIVSLEQGGDDRSDNMLVLCERHHNQVHIGLIQIQLSEKICINYLSKKYYVMNN